jgi:hypothetical protein
MKASETLAVENETSQSLKEQLSSLIDPKNGESQDLVILKAIQKFVGNDLKTATFLIKLIEWSDHPRTWCGWIDRSESEWCEDTGLSLRKLGRASRFLHAMGVLEAKITFKNGPNVEYKLDQQALKKALRKYLKGDYSRVAHYKLKEDTDPSKFQLPITFPEFYSLCKFFDEDLQFLVLGLLNRNVDYPKEIDPKFPINKWMNLCNAISETLNENENSMPMDRYVGIAHEYFRFCQV